MLKVSDGTGPNTIAGAQFTVKDLTPPAVTVGSPTGGTAYDRRVALSAVAVDNASGVDRVEYRIDNGSWTRLPAVDPATGRYGVEWVPEDAVETDHTASFRATDKAGITSNAVTVSFRFRPETAPTAPSLAGPAAGGDVNTPTPLLVVNNASDPNSDALFYSFEVYGDSGLTTLIASAGGIGQGEGTTSFQVPAPLAENGTYYWRCRAFDGELYGYWMEPAAFRVNVANDPPSAPVPASPADLSPVSVPAPVLAVNNATDPDSAELMYNFAVALDPDFTRIVASATGVPSGPGATSWQVPVDLQENGWYYWRAQADDWIDTGPWSPSSRFFVNTANDAPTAPVITGPADRSVVPALETDVAAANATDPDSTALSYLFELDTVPTFDSTRILRSGYVPEGQGTTTWHATGLRENTWHYVRAKASDGLAESAWSAVNSFFVSSVNDPPAAPLIANPSNGAGVTLLSPVLSVHDATDPDNDSLTYEFQVYGDPAMTDIVALEAGVAETQSVTSWTVTTALEENRTYFWRVRAFDGSLASGWTQASSFFVNTVNDAPTAPVLSVPADGSSAATLTPALSVVNATDPENDGLTYNFEVFAGGGLVYSVYGVPGDPLGITSITTDTALPDNSTYQWRCRAFDGERYGPWMDTASFTIHVSPAGIAVNVEIEPETLNGKDRGRWVLATIELPHGYDASDVDISSIRLEGTVPAEPWPYELKRRRSEQGCDADHREHDHGVLKVRFPRRAVLDVLPAGRRVPVHVNGRVKGTPFEGMDFVRVIESGNKYDDGTEKEMDAVTRNQENEEIRRSESCDLHSPDSSREVQRWPQEGAFLFFVDAADHCFVQDTITRQDEPKMMNLFVICLLPV